MTTTNFWVWCGIIHELTLFSYFILSEEFQNFSIDYFSLKHLQNLILLFMYFLLITRTYLQKYGNTGKVGETLVRLGKRVLV
jgi:hypothetical protein